MLIIYLLYFFSWFTINAYKLYNEPKVHSKYKQNKIKTYPFSSYNFKTNNAYSIAQHYKQVFEKKKIKV